MQVAFEDGDGNLLTRRAALAVLPGEGERIVVKKSPHQGDGFFRGTVTEVRWDRTERLLTVRLDAVEDVGP